MVVVSVHRRAEDGHDEEGARVVRCAARVEVALLHARDAPEHGHREQEDEAWLGLGLGFGLGLGLLG